MSFLFGIPKAIINNYKKAEAAVIVENLLRHIQNNGGFSMFSDNPAEKAREYVQAVWDKKPDIFNGEFEQRPHKLSVAAQALALSAKTLYLKNDSNFLAVFISLQNLLAEIEVNGSFYPFTNMDTTLMQESALIFIEIAEKEQNAIREPINITKNATFDNSTTNLEEKEIKPKSAMNKQKQSDIIITEEFKKCFELLENTTNNVFVTGKAGTGKSTFLNYYRSNSKKNVVVVAPTGIAALNVEGKTIHTFFNFKPGFMEPKKRWYALPDLRKLYKKMDVLIIDEISMVRADLFDAIESFLSINGKNPGQPFGGCQICIIGDLYQLPPIVTKNESDAYYRFYNTEYFFGAKSFKNYPFIFFELTHNFRQSEHEFIEFLNNIRMNRTNNSILEWFNKLSYERQWKKGLYQIS